MGPEQGDPAAADDHRLRRFPRQPLAHSARWHCPGIGTSKSAFWRLRPEAGPRQDHEGKVKGKAAPGITAKDIVLAIVGKTSSASGTSHVVEFCGEAIRDPVSMEGRMTLCNMAIRGAKAGLGRAG